MPLLADLRAAIQDEALHNVELVGTDGGTVTTNKTLLALRSPVCRSMFAGNLADRTTARVNLAYPAATVLRVLVTYCGTDELDLDGLYTDDDDDDNDEGSRSVVLLRDAEVVAMLQLRHAAKYLELHELHACVSHELGDSLRHELPCVCTALQELDMQGGAAGSTEADPLWDVLMDWWRQVPAQCAFSATHQGIKAVSLQLLLKLLAEPGLDSFVAAKALQTWYTKHEIDDHHESISAQL